ncbi:hypothetical protein HHK36_008073 [Tetracentron sinense]|uniref:Endoplasmic reticulum-Golgi intermediate compartment protein 3 n=1 Tax=Tetracentron sinense TaxID=13715 RepID=A0A835DIY7_TETSI|nr:hypothetical protein HHK36_008073 [Tetracentron sinense]
MDIFNKLRNLDAYPKINEDFYSRTLSGGVITLASSIVMLLLFISELRLYLHAVTETKLIVDTSRGETLRINFDVTFPALPCSLLSLDAMDISGEQHLDVRHDIIKKRIDAHGNVIETRQDGIGAPKIEKPLQRHGGRLEHNETYCGSCYGAEMSDDDCCNSCEEVREAYRKKGWGLSNPDIIDQVCRYEIHCFCSLFSWSSQICSKLKFCLGQEIYLRSDCCCYSSGANEGVAAVSGVKDGGEIVVAAACWWRLLQLVVRDEGKGRLLLLNGGRLGAYCKWIADAVSSRGWTAAVVASGPCAMLLMKGV